MRASERKARHKNRRMRELAQIDRQVRSLHSGHDLAQRLMKKADAGVDSLGLHTNLAPVIAIFSLSLAQAYSKEPDVKERLSAAMPFVAAEAMLRMVPTLYMYQGEPSGIEDACQIHDLLYEAKRWHEDER